MLRRIVAKSSRQSYAAVLRVRCLTLRWLTALCLATLPGARANASDTPYQLNPALDATTMAASAVVWWTPALSPTSFLAADGCSCRSASLNALDRPFAGSYSAGFSVAGELLIGAVYAASVLLDLLDVVRADQPISSFLVDFAVIAEALLVNGA